jgi:hypothetical protein
MWLLQVQAVLLEVDTVMLTAVAAEAAEETLLSLQPIRQ